MFKINILLLTSLFCKDSWFGDSAAPYQLGFQDPATPIAEGIQDIHHHVFFFLTIIFIFVC